VEFGGYGPKKIGTSLTVWFHEKLKFLA